MVVVWVLPISSLVTQQFCTLWPRAYSFLSNFHLSYYKSIFKVINAPKTYEQLQYLRCTLEMRDAHFVFSHLVIFEFAQAFMLTVCLLLAKAVSAT